MAVDLEELSERVKVTNKVWVRLYNDLIFCLIEKIDDKRFKAKVVPCAKNSREYVVLAAQVKEYIDRE